VNQPAFSPQEFLWALSGVNLVVLLGIVLRAGKLLASLETVTSEVSKLRVTSDLHTEMLAKTVSQLDDLERRVGRLERQQDSR